MLQPILRKELDQHEHDKLKSRISELRIEGEALIRQAETFMTVHNVSQTKESKDYFMAHATICGEKSVKIAKLVDELTLELEQATQPQVV